jgi:uncharacterized membrane protein
MPPVVLFLIMILAGVGFVYVGMKTDGKAKIISMFFSCILILIGGFGLFTSIL